jgi:hypothetical protein
VSIALNNVLKSQLLQESKSQSTSGGMTKS